MIGLMPDRKNGDVAGRPYDPWKHAYGGCREKCARKALNNIRGSSIEDLISV